MASKVYKRSCLRYAHTAGYTNVIFTGDGESMVTCGSDGDIRRWTGIDDDDPSSTCLGEFVVCLAQNKDKNLLLAATDRNTVQAYSYPEMETNGIIFRFTAAATCICVQGEVLAAGSEDTTIKVRYNDLPPVDLEGHEGPVLALDIHPQCHLLASVAGDGRLKIWDIKNLLTSTDSDGKIDQNSCSELRTLDFGLHKTNSYENSTCFGTVCFEPCHGGSLVYIKSKELIIVNTSTWERQGSLSDNKIEGILTCCQFSRDGRLLAAGSDKGEIAIFDVGTRHLLKCEEAARECKSITSLAWLPKNNDELAYCDDSGQLGTLFIDEDVEDSTFPNAAEQNVFGEIEFADDDTRQSTKSQESNIRNDSTDNDNDDDGVSLEKLKSRVMSFAKGRNSDEEIDENTRDSVKSSSPLSPEPVVNNTFKQQSSFQPASTPLHLEHRYLTWNSVGIVTLHSDNAEGSIDVEFHDTGVHHTLHIPNYNNHNMASLSDTVLAMAESGSSKLVCIALSTGSNKEWSFQLPDCESIDAIVATSRLVAVATNNHFLRLFTILGTQREIISLPGPVVCLAGYEDRLLICYHGSPSGVRQQYIAGMLLQTAGWSLKCQNIQIALAPERLLVWVGFSDVGSPVFLDSMGLIQLFSLKSNCWHPICDTMKLSSSISNRYFVVSVSESSQIIHAVLCRGTAYPMTTPRPMVQELPMQLPLCDLDNEKSVLEDSLLRSCIMQVKNAEKSIKENAIKLFALSCRNEMEPRAKELIETIACPELLTLAIKYASKLGRIHLSDRLSDLVAQMGENHLKCDEISSIVDDKIPLSSAFIQKSMTKLNVYEGSSLDVASSSSTKLAPKIMSSGSIKKSTLKRLTYNTPKQNNLFSNLRQNIENSPVSQESIDPSISSLISQQPRSSTGNAVNPFAAKRKIAEVDKGGSIVMGTNKLKMVKKD